MTQGRESNTRALEEALAVEDGAWQLTIDGGAVRHPPPAAPRGKCPECEKLITFNDDGTFRQHNIFEGERCPMSGGRLNQ